MKAKINILGVCIDALTKEKLYKKIGNLLKSEDKIKIFTPNPQILIKAQKNESIKDILNLATISIPDGTGVIWASKILGTPLPERLTGIDTAEYILTLAAKKNLSVFLLGGQDDVVKSAKSRLEEKYRGLKICGVHHGFFDLQGDKNKQVISLINASDADILFVCMGFPRQEIWITENMPKLSSVRLSIGLGGSLDVWSGRLRRAPALFRNLSLEWLWRMILEPKRIRFLPIIPVFVFKILRERCSKGSKLSKNNGKNALKQAFFGEK